MKICSSKKTKNAETVGIHLRIMGSAGSITSGKDIEDDDEFGKEIESGVTKKIPIECAPSRTKSTSVKSVGSFAVGKKKSRRSSKDKPVTKSTSLRSALSFDQEGGKSEGEPEQIRAFRTVYDAKVITSKTEIAALEVIKEKLHSENQRLRSEVKALTSTCTKLRNERAMALEAKEQAFQRAAAFEKERDKVQRQFKLFRESKEREIQDVLLAKRELEMQIQRYLSMTSHDEQRLEVVDNLATDWFTSSLESDPSVDSLTQVTSFRGPEFFQSPMEREGPFTNISRDDWNAVAPSVLQQVSSSLQAPVQQQTIRVYLSAPDGMRQEVDLLKQLYIPKLEWLCERQEKFLVVVHLEDPVDELNDEELAARVQLRCDQIKNSKVFVAFLGGKSNRFTGEEYNQARVSCPGRCHAIFCFKNLDWKGYPSLKDENIFLAEQLKTEIRKADNIKLLDNYETSEKGAMYAYQELKKFINKELGLADDQPTQCDYSLSYGSLRDSTDEWEQVEALKAAAECSCEIGLSKFYSDLNEHVSSAGLKGPMLVKGEAGFGKSLLLAKWIALQQSSLSGRLILYHFVGSMSSSSANPVLMLRRFTIQLLKQLGSSRAVTCDPVQLEEEFPRWLERAASKLHGGVTLVIDSADRLQGAPSHMQWLLDPLPVGARVILSVTESTCPMAWRPWSSLELCPLDLKGSSDLLLACLSQNGQRIPQEQVNNMLEKTSSEGRYNPRFIRLLSAQLAACKDRKAFVDCFEASLSKKNALDLLCHILCQITTKFSPILSERIMKKIFLHIMTARNGISESELLNLVPVAWYDWLMLFSALQHSGITVTRMGLVLFANEQVRLAVNQTILLHEDMQESKEVEEAFMNFFEKKLSVSHVTWRVTDELLWSLKKACKDEKLKECLLNADVFKLIFERGRFSELINYWHYLGVDQATLGMKYIDVVKHMEEENKLSASTAEMFEVVGRFLKCFGLLSQAAPLFQRALEIRETVLDPDHPLVAQSLHHLASLNAQWGKFTPAEAFFKQAIEIKENALGNDHPSLVKDLEGLAFLYKKLEKHAMAGSLRKKAEAIKQKSNSSVNTNDLKKKTLQVEELARESPSPELARSLNELGVLNFLQNNHEVARSCFHLSLEMRESLQGPDHPDVAQSLHNLAAFYNDQKMYDKAEPLYVRAYQIRLKAFPPHHSSVASTIKHLTVLYRKQGKYTDAEPLYRQALEIREKTFGKSHPSVATALNNLAVVLCLQNRQSEALPLYERALQIYEEMLGTSHPRVAETLVNLAKLLYDLGSPEKAAHLYKRANDIKEREPHPGLSRHSSLSLISNNSPGKQSAALHAHDSVSRVLSISSTM